MPGRKPRQPPVAGADQAPGAKKPGGQAQPARTAANSAKVELLPGHGAQIHELRPAPGHQDAVISATRDSADPYAGEPGTKKPGAREPAGQDAGTQASPEASILAFPEPPVRRRRRYFLASAGAAAVLAAALLFVLFFSPALALKNLQVEGNSLLAAEEAETALAPLLGIPLTRISDNDAAKLLADRPEVESVRVTAVPPSDLVVTITERVPVAVLQNGREFLLIDEDGRQLKAVASRGDASLPLIDGGTEAVNSDVFPTITAVLAALPPNVLALLDHASAETVDSVELKLTSGQTVFWGSAEANVAKARALEALLLMPAAEPPVSVFDVSTPNRPVTR